ncbi:MAG: thioredoxin domain-containing protein [Cyanobacteria bacterium P01_D01_bin.50]
MKKIKSNKVGYFFNLGRGLASSIKSIKIFAISIVIVFCSNLSPAVALTQIDPVIEEQVIQILREHPEVITESVERYQKQQLEEKQKATKALLEQFQTTPEKLIAQSPVTGDIQDKIILAEFSDFQCPYCGRASKTVSQFIDKYSDRVVLVYKHFPLTRIHPQAYPAAKAAWAAAQQGKFWEYHDALFSQQKQLGESLYVGIAEALSLDIEQFNRDRNSVTAQIAIEQDMELGNQLGVSGTPFFVMKDKVFSGAVELSEFEKLLAEVS